jgi:hypothetical protein
MFNDEISSQASEILRVFGHEQLYLLYQEMHMLVEVWHIDEHECEKLCEDPEDSADLIKLLRSAIILSRIADMYSKKFDKISHKHWHFWKKCEEIAQKVAEEVL